MMKRDDPFAGYEQGQRDMLAKCIAAVEALTNKIHHPWATVGDALAALRGLQKKA